MSSFSGKFHSRKVNMFAKGCKVRKKNSRTGTFSAPLPPIVHLDCLLCYITRQRPGAPRNLFSGFHHTFMWRHAAAACGDPKHFGCRLFAHVIQSR